MNSFFRKPVFWISFIIISAISFAFAFKYFSKAFPIVNITITMDRGQAISESNDLAELFGWGPQDPSVAVSFDSDSKAQRFIELEGGGQDAFLNMMQQKWYIPYTWKVRRFKQFQTNETEIYFTPDGKLYGFKETISEDKELNSLSKKGAIALVMQALKENLQIDLTPYALIEDAKDIQQNGRIDRTFVFERTDITLNEGRYRIKTKVSGDKLTLIKQFIKIPQSFTFKYREMRAANESIAYAAGIFAYIFYLLIGCVFGLFILMRLNWVIWQAPIKWALLISSLKFISTLNSMPLMWMYYNTENSMQGFLLNIIVQSLTSFFMTFITTSLIFITAESLTRRAFGSHVRLWSSWDTGIANSYTILGRTIGSYLIIGIDMAFLVLFYFITTHYFNWWAPLSQLVNPNILANYFPWLSSIASSLSAGFVEEAQFRAIPLAGAALIGDRFGKRKWWIFGAFILQAIVFGGAHANYAAQPAYARLIELIFPSFLFGLMYLRFGLLTSVITHYAYDVFWFSLPIFLSTAPRIWINQTAVLFFTFLPLGIILYRRLQEGKWQKLTPDAYNGTWLADKPTITTEDVIPTVSKKLTNRNALLIIIASICGLAAWIFATKFNSNAPPLKLYRNDAIAIAKQYLEQQQIPIDGFQPYAQIKPTFEKQEKVDLQHKYIWQQYQQPIYATLLGSYLNPPHWLVRFLKFSGSLAERGESYQAIVGANTFDRNTLYNVLSLQHKIPESIAGTQLNKKEARSIAQQALVDDGNNLDDLYEVSATPKQLPDRKDWVFIYANKIASNTLKGEKQIVISITGDTVTHLQKKIHMPETWQRNERKQRNTTQALQLLCHLLIRMLFIFGMLIALLRWANKKLHTKTFVMSLLFFTLLFTIKLCNNWPHLISQFNTQAPFANQLFMTFSVLMLQFLMRAAVFAFVLSLIIDLPQRFVYKKWLSTLSIGVSAGLLLSGSWALIELMQPSIEPLWGFYNTLGTWSNAIGYTNAHLLKFIQYTLAYCLGIITLNYITHHGKKHLAIAFGLCIIASLCLNGIDSLEIISYWLSSSICYGIVLMLIWYILLRFSLPSVPFAIATMFSLNILQQMIFDLLPNMWITGTISIVCIVITAVLLSINMERKHA
ncbi:MAG: type II CAAX endopeptidase family protein [Candidatus Dependentiae bacterium]